ncbi:MAG: DUF167 domain-containing protein [Planctomycetota bacterium]|jgi:hypothetical protein|nr:DUF167 domain-containing protein [Planctomycetota bacterium]
MASIADLSLIETAHGISFKVWAIPGSSRERIVGVHGDALKISVSAPPQKGKANKRILALLANQLQISPRQISLESGTTSRDKSVRVQDLTAEKIRCLLAPILLSQN